MKTAREAYTEVFLGRNIKENEEIILYYNCPNHSCLFAMEIPNADIKAHEKVVLESNEPSWCFAFAKNVSGADRQTLSKSVLQSSNKFWIEMFYLNVDFDKTEYEKYLMFL